jgi:hypothetical protein
MGCHILDTPFKVLGLGYPSEIECSVANVYEEMWTAAYHPDSFPVASRIKFKFKGRDGKSDLYLHWSDGGILPDRPAELGPDEYMGDGNGTLIIGTKGKMLSGLAGDNPALLPTARTREINVPQTIARVPEGHYIQWVNACIAGYGKNQLSSSFDYAGPLTETVLMGNLALMAWNIRNDKGEFTGRKKLMWDADNMKVTNYDEVNRFVKREYKNGYGGIGQ